jgi:beta-phosphoglucomutase-like phosphatase (HAD superfamily)
LEEYKKPLPSSFFKEQIEGSMDLFRSRLKPLMTNTVKQLASISSNTNTFTMCVSSGSPRARVKLCLEVAGIMPYFNESSIFTREQVNKGKPAPDLFLYSAKEMGNVSSDQCLVIEDSTAGIEAALNAGMEVIAYLGGGHTTADWYQKAIYSYNVPTVHTEQEVFDLIHSKVAK